MTGEDLYNLGLTRIGVPYVLGAVVPKDDASWVKDFDCAEFASWLTYQVGRVLFGCDTYDVAKAHTADAYTGYWKRDCDNGKLIIISVAEGILTKGAYLLRYASDGEYGHIICSDGNGGTVEANSTKYGTGQFKTANRRFDIGVLIPEVIYTKSEHPIESLPNQKPKGIVYRYTQPLMPESEVVKNIQISLKSLGYDLGFTDGIYGKKTMNAVAAFQKNHGLTPDGEVYTQTAKALNVTL